MALRQQIWEREGERTEFVDHSSGDYPRWIDTSTMISDPLTKVMNINRLTQTFMTGLFDMKPTPESLMVKEKNRLQRRAKKLWKARLSPFPIMRPSTSGTCDPLPNFMFILSRLALSNSQSTSSALSGLLIRLQF